MKRFLSLLLAVVSTQGLFANSQVCYDNNNCATDSCWDFCNADFYAYVDWLYWKARRCDLDIATVNGVAILSPTVSVVPVEGRTICLDHKYHSGVRAGVGLEWCSGWGFGLEYIYFNPTERQRVLTTDPNLVTLTRVPGLLFFNVPNEVNARYALKLNQADILFTYKHGCNPCRNIRSFFGARLAWIDDGFDTTYAGNVVADGEIVGTFVTNLAEATSLNAYGLLVGGQVFQDLWCSLGLYMKASLGVLYGSYDQHSGVTYTGVAGLPGFRVNDDCSCLLSTIDLAVGLGFQGCNFCCATWNFIVGYEFHNWFAYRDYLRPLTGFASETNVFIRNKSDLGFDGLFVRLGVEF